jgi:glycosyltransferase involved in cell wall biosynthesis
LITVIFATFNGANTLPRVLDAYTQIAAPAGGWKLIVADNGSTDSTPQIIERFTGRLPIARVPESRRGKNAAVNAALPLVEGDLVVFTDDDAIPDKDWLLHYRAAADTQHEHDIFGGTILPEWERPPEAWLLSLPPQDITYTLTDPGLQEGSISPRKVFGVNFAIRSRFIRDGFKFCESIGPRGKNYPMGSETELLMRLENAGAKAWHCKQAKVRHIIRAHQMRKKWILQRAVRFGRGQAALRKRFGNARCKTVGGIPRYLFGMLATQTARMILASLRFDSERLFRARWEVNYLKGKILGWAGTAAER